VGATTAAPTNYQGPAADGTMPNQPGNVSPAPGASGTYAPNAFAPRGTQGGYPGPATAATPGYTGRNMPGMAGYNTVNPMGTTMSPPYYYAGSAGMPYATYNTPGYTGAAGAPSMYGPTTAYPSGYITPGTNVTQFQNYRFQRRGLFGRRNRVVYPASPYGSSSYGSYPSGYTTYGTTTYYSAPGTYSYGTNPY
jgi:hypothetical protein